MGRAYVCVGDEWGRLGGWDVWVACVWAGRGVGECVGQVLGGHRREMVSRKREEA